MITAKLHSKELVLMKWLVLLILVIVQIEVQGQTSSKTLDEARGVEVGTIIQNFRALDANSKEFQLKEALRNGPVVIVFYRGQWCPYCNKYLSHLQDSLSYITEKGATVIAISPEKPEHLQETAEKTKSTFTLLYDEGYAVCDMFEVTFQPDERTIQMYNEKLSANLAQAQSDETGRLPVPATFILNKSGEIVWLQFDRDYKNRAQIKDIIHNIPQN